MACLEQFFWIVEHISNGKMKSLPGWNASSNRLLSVEFYSLKFRFTDFEEPFRTLSQLFPKLFSKTFGFLTIRNC